MAKTKPQATTIANGEDKRSGKSQKQAKPTRTSAARALASSAARKNILGRIGKPYKNSTKAQKKFFRDFLTRLEERDKALEQTDLELASEDAMNHVFDNEDREMKLEWEVEEILDAATINGELHYMVLWKGHLIEQCTWESEANMANSRDTIEDFYTAFPNKTKGPGVKKRGRKPAVGGNA